MADGDPQYVKVTMKAVFVAYNEVYRPGVDYILVSTDIYNSTLPDDVQPQSLKGVAFKDLCATAEPFVPPVMP